MEKLNKRIEIITDIASVKIVDSKEDGMVTIKINDWNLVPFQFDWEKFYMEATKRDELEKFISKIEKEEKKLNRDKTETERRQDMKELQSLPTELQEITILYRKDPESKLINMVSYIKEIIEW